MVFHTLSTQSTFNFNNQHFPLKWQYGFSIINFSGNQPDMYWCTNTWPKFASIFCQSSEPYLNYRLHTTKDCETESPKWTTYNTNSNTQSTSTELCPLTIANHSSKWHWTIFYGALLLQNTSHFPGRKQKVRELSHATL